MFRLRRRGDARRRDVHSAGSAGMPAAAESVCVARDVQLADLTGARLHIAHLSAQRFAGAGARGEAARIAA